MNQKGRDTLSSSIFLTFFFCITLIHRSASLPLAIQNVTSDKSKDVPSIRQNPPCNLTCQNNDCTIKPNFCYIEEKCYEENDTYLNSSLTCLQCQPMENQTHWQLKEACLPFQECSNPLSVMLNTCPPNIFQDFYVNPENAVMKHYNFDKCGGDRRQCQAGFFFKDDGQPIACCPGFFCPEGQSCMIPCRNGSYCPSLWPPFNHTCQAPVDNCPKDQTREYDFYGCGGSTVESFCPEKWYCPNATVKIPCSDKTHYCPTGTKNQLLCPSGFVCLNGQAKRTRLLTNILIVAIVLIFAFVLIAELSQWLMLKKKLLGNLN
jgi:hypothetical protein